MCDKVLGLRGALVPLFYSVMEQTDDEVLRYLYDKQNAKLEESKSALEKGKRKQK